MLNKTNCMDGFKHGWEIMWLLAKNNPKLFKSSTSKRVQREIRKNYNNGMITFQNIPNYNRGMMSSQNIPKIWLLALLII